jgi:hypothetical protein
VNLTLSLNNFLSCDKKTPDDDISRQKFGGQNLRALKRPVLHGTQNTLQHKMLGRPLPRLDRSMSADKKIRYLVVNCSSMVANKRKHLEKFVLQIFWGQNHFCPQFSEQDSKGGARSTSWCRAPWGGVTVGRTRGEA